MNKGMGLRVRTRRKQLGLTQAQLAEQVGCSQPMIRKIELGSETSLARKLAVALRVSVDWLETGEESPKDASLDQAWPFSFSYERFMALDEVDIARADGYLLHLVEQREAERHASQKKWEKESEIKAKSLLPVSC